MSEDHTFTTATGPDIDNDGVPDELDPDDDNDGMPDDWEHLYGFDPLVNDSGEDVDNDNLTNLEEYSAGTNPTVADTDGDGWNDGEELYKYYTSPIDIDTDGDGYPEGKDMYPLDPYRWKAEEIHFDSDSDGIPDWWEIRYGLNPNVADAHLDFDDDNYTNLEEYEADTNPTDPKSYPDQKVAAPPPEEFGPRIEYVSVILGIIIGIAVGVVIILLIKRGRSLE
jgi:hypothetical protein